MGMVRLAIAGSGGMAHYHAKKFSSIPSCEVDACKDHVLENAIQFARAHNIPHWFDNLSELLAQKRANALSCAVIDRRHASMCTEALNGDLAVFCEKPMTRTLSEAENLAALATERGLTTYVNYSKRNAPALHALKRLVSHRDLGKIESVCATYHQGWVATGMWGDWRTVPRWRWRLLPEDCTAGVVGDLGSHVVDALLFVFGELSIEKITEAIDMRMADKCKLLGDLRPTPEFLSATSAWLQIEAQCQIPSVNSTNILITTIDKNSLDDFSIVVIGERATAVMDLRKSRSTVTVTTHDTGISTEITGNPVASTYEQFCQLVNTDNLDLRSTLPQVVPDFSYGLKIQRILNSLAPGGLAQ
jgi:predicted dehydrogenase